MKTVKLTTAQAVIRFLSNQYISVDGIESRFVEGVFAVFGHGNVLGIGQALEQDPGNLILRQGKNEQGMAHAAIAFAKQNNRKKIYACTSSVGPGAANMVTAAALATANNIPLLLLPGDTFSTRQPDPVLQQIEQPQAASVTTNDAFFPVCRYWDRVSRPEQLMSAMNNAIRVLTSDDTGAVCIALPQDVQAEAWDFPESFFRKQVHRIIRRAASPEEIEAAVQLTSTKKKPLIICGGGARYSQAGESLKKFARQFNIPFCETQAGKSTAEGTFPLNLGGVGVTGNLAANTIAEQADLIIGLGTRFTDFTSGSKSLFRNENVEFISMNVSEYHAGKMDSLKIVGDAKTCLDQLACSLQTAGYKSGYSDEIESAQQAWEKERKRLYSISYSQKDFKPEIEEQAEKSVEEFCRINGGALSQTTAIGEINRFLQKDYIIVGASGSLPGDLQRLWVSNEKESYHMEYGYSCMGYEIAGALGAKLACPDKEVYSMVGDGSFLMLHSELVTALQEGQKINILLFDNGGFGCINNLQMSNGMGSYGTEFRYRRENGGLDGRFLSIDYAKCAEAYGAKGYKVTTLQQLKDALADAKKQKVSTLIDIKTLPKTMTHGYRCWWHVGVAEISQKPEINQAYKNSMKELDPARKY